MTGELHIGFSQNEQIGFVTQTCPLLEVQENGKYKRESQHNLKGITDIFCTQTVLLYIICSLSLNENELVSQTLNNPFYSVIQNNVQIPHQPT